jgi:hypothetical protein
MLYLFRYIKKLETIDKTSYTMSGYLSSHIEPCLFISSRLCIELCPIRKGYLLSIGYVYLELLVCISKHLYIKHE